MSLHLAEVAQAVVPGAQGVILMDRAGWHRAKDLVVPDNLTLGGRTAGPATWRRAAAPA